jgi:hypothetical protein
MEVRVWELQVITSKLFWWLVVALVVLEMAAAGVAVELF